MKLDLVPRTCPICGSADDSRVFAESNLDPLKLDAFAFASRKLPEYMHARLIECPNCSLLYTNPALAPESLEDAYRDAAYDSRGEAVFASATYARFLPRIKRRLHDCDGAIDIGTGEGSFLRELLAAGFTNVMGVEPSLAPVQAAAPDIRPLIRQELFRPGAFEPESASLVTCFQTIEHVPDPLELCREAYRILKPGGALFLIGHNRRALSAKVLGRKSPIFDIEHLQLFCPESFRKLFGAAGFEDVQVTPLWNRYPLAYWTRLFPFPRGLKSGLIAALNSTGVGKIPVGIPAGNLAAIGFKRSPRGSDANVP